METSPVQWRLVLMSEIDHMIWIGPAPEMFPRILVQTMLYVFNAVPFVDQLRKEGMDSVIGNSPRLLGSVSSEGPSKRSKIGLRNLSIKVVVTRDTLHLMSLEQG